MGKSKIIGIDLGTGYSCVSYFENGEPVVIPNAQGERTTPSVVSFNSDGSRLVGSLAKRQAIQQPKKTVSSIKRFMGRRFAETVEERKLATYDVAAHSESVKVNIDGKLYSPQEISSFVLQSLKTSAEAYFGEAVTDAVITVPAYFNDAQRTATKEAGEICGITVRRILNEPTAAALAYGLHSKKDGIIVIFDFGSGTFDTSILEISKTDGEQLFEVKSTNGNTRLGGDDVDNILINYVADTFQKQHGIDLRKDPMALQRLKDACERSKCELSSAFTTTISLPFITQGADKNAIHLSQELTRAKFENLCESLFEQLIPPCQQCLTDAGIKLSDITEVILVGGSTRIPKVQEIAEKIFQRKPNKSINPDEAVAMGAAVQASILENPQKASITFLDVTPLSLGIELEGGLMHILVEKNTTIPTQRKETFSTTTDAQPAVDVEIYQGDRRMAKDNRMLGRFRLDGIPSAPRGIPKIEVAFDIDQNGILKVSAKDLGTGKEQKITVQSSSGLNKADIDRMRKEAEQYAAADEAKRGFAELKNDCDKLIHSARKGIKEYGTKLASPDITEIESSIKSLEKSLGGTDTKQISGDKDKLESAFHKATASLYETANAATPTDTEQKSEG